MIKRLIKSDQISNQILLKVRLEFLGNIIMSAALLAVLSRGSIGFVNDDYVFDVCLYHMYLWLRIWQYQANMFMMQLARLLSETFLADSDQDLSVILFFLQCSFHIPHQM